MAFFKTLFLLFRDATLGFALASFVLTFFILENSRKILKAISIRDIFSQAKKHINFPKFTITSKRFWRDIKNHP